MRISDWSSDVCSSDLLAATVLAAIRDRNNLDTATVDDIIWSTSSQNGKQGGDLGRMAALSAGFDTKASGTTLDRFCGGGISSVNFAAASVMSRSEEHTSELQSLMRISYAVFCLKKKTKRSIKKRHTTGDRKS